ncbi:unnamed protein product [Paramecium pentaurelia]|uniref:Transmembrane protein n=1 Tax=Paramecium pentaurelia TaxID=43138 RepID=A0A8S1YHH1_9CILI|nr:unnamed protein product [Paramecium pentaurelia]
MVIFSLEKPFFLIFELLQLFLLYITSYINSYSKISETLNHIINIHQIRQQSKSIDLSHLQSKLLKCKYHSQNFKCFLLTDGEDFLKKQLSQYKQNEDMKLEINHCSEYLVKRLAEVGNGEYQLVGYNEDINYKVIVCQRFPQTFIQSDFHQYIILKKFHRLFLIQNQQLNQRKVKSQLYKFYFQRRKIQNSKLIVLTQYSITSVIITISIVRIQFI